MATRKQMRAGIKCPGRARDRYSLSLPPHSSWFERFSKKSDALNAASKHPRSKDIEISDTMATRHQLARFNSKGEKIT